MTDFTWSITALQIKPTEGSYKDVVVIANWNCTGIEVVNAIEFASSQAGECTFPPPEGQFTPYDQLTQDQVLSWCWANGVNKTEVEAQIQDYITYQANPALVPAPLPWVPEPPPTPTPTPSITE